MRPGIVCEGNRIERFAQVLFIGGTKKGKVAAPQEVGDEQTATATAAGNKKTWQCV